LSSVAALIQNENMKIYRRPRTWAMIGILIAAIGLMVGLMKYYEPKASTTDWKQELAQTNKHLQDELAKLPADAHPNEKSWYERSIKKNNYYLEHNINPNENTLWSIVQSSTNLIMLVTILTVIVAADMIAAEYSSGTMKLLLIRPASRAKILLSKYVSTFIFAIAMLVLLFSVTFLLGGLFEGFGGFDQQNVFFGNDGEIHQSSMVLDVLQKYGWAVVELVLYVTFAFMISAAFRSSSMAIAFSLMLMLVGNTIVGIFRNYDWIKYTLFANIHLSQYVEGGTPPRPDMTLMFSVIVLVCYFAVFNLVSWLLFTKRDVTA